jgi:hypothetical protein
MSEPVRIRDDGREPDRALLRATPPPPAPGLQERLRQSIEQRVSATGSRWRRWWAAGLFGLLGTGTAFAIGTAPGRQLIHILLGSELPADLAPAAPPARGPEWNPLPVPEPPAPPPPALQPPRPRKTDHATTPPIILHPGLRQPPGEWPLSDEAVESDNRAPRPKPATSLLRITRQGRTIELRATADAIEGYIRGAAVSLRVEGARLVGKIGDYPIDLFLRNDQGRGSIGNEATGFGLAPTDEGAIVRGWVPEHSVRVELNRAGLSLHPGCERLLKRQAAGVYQGACADGDTMKLALPAAFETMPLFPRLVALGLLLTERDPIFRLQKPGMFPDPL